MACTVQQAHAALDLVDLTSGRSKLGVAAAADNAHVSSSNIGSLVIPTSRSSKSAQTSQTPATNEDGNTPTLSQAQRFGKNTVTASRSKTAQLTSPATIASPPEIRPTLTYDLNGVRPASRSKRKTTPAIRRQIATDRLGGASISDLMQRYGLARSSINTILNKEGVPRQRNIIGEQHRAELERLRRQGLTIAQIATRFGTSASTVSRAMKRLGVEVLPT